MKKLLLCMALISVNATADTYAIAPNKIGGYTILSQMPCPLDKKLKTAYATDHTNTSVAIACWYAKDDKVIFNTKSGTIRSMPIEIFELINENR